MPRLKALIFELPPYATGYWCSLARALFGALLLSKLADAATPAMYMDDPGQIISMALNFLFAMLLTVGLFTRAVIYICSAICLVSFYLAAFELPNLLHLPLVGPGSYGEPTNIYYLGVVLLFLGLTPCADYFSLDAIRKKTEPRAEKLWGVQLILYQLCAVYLWAAIAKLDPTFLTGHSLEMAWIRMGPGSLGYFHTPEGTRFFQLFGRLVILSEFSLAFMLFFPRLRKWGIGLGFLFHVGATMVFPVRDFTFAVLITYLLFLDTPKHHGGVRAPETKTDF